MTPSATGTAPPRHRPAPATTYAYDALNRRVSEDKDGPGPTTGSAHPTVNLYYSANWQVLEECENGVAKRQNVWSPARLNSIWVDALVLRDRDADGNAGNGLEERLYVAQDANYNVTALFDIQGEVVERYVYDPYGRVTVLDATFSPDADGISDVAWAYLHQGGRHDASLKLSHFRHRDLHVDLGRWTRQDPLGYVDGANVYQAYISSPVDLVDPSGLLGHVAIGGLIGGGVGFIGGFIHGGWEGAVNGAVSGAVAGAVTAATFNPALGIAAGGLGIGAGAAVAGGVSGGVGALAGGLVAEGLDVIGIGDGTFDGGEVIEGVIIGVITGGLGGFILGGAVSMAGTGKKGIFLKAQVHELQELTDDAVVGVAAADVQLITEEVSRYWDLY